MEESQRLQQEFERLLQELRERAHEGCGVCSSKIAELEYWLRELREAVEERRVVMERYGGTGVLEGKLRATERTEFMAVEMLEELSEEMSRHLEGGG